MYLLCFFHLFSVEGNEFIMRFLEALLKSACRHSFSIYNHQQEAEKNTPPAMLISGESRWPGTTVQGKRPWGHLASAASSCRPPFPPRWAPGFHTGCCTAASARRSAWAPWREEGGPPLHSAPAARGWTWAVAPCGFSVVPEGQDAKRPYWLRPVPSTFYTARKSLGVSPPKLWLPRGSQAYFHRAQNLLWHFQCSRILTQLQKLDDVHFTDRSPQLMLWWGPQSWLFPEGNPSRKHVSN